MEHFLKQISALNDETRLKILRFITINKKVCVCDVENSFKMIQSRVSRHLKILKDGGFLRVNRDGRWAYYSISSNLSEFEQTILDTLSKLDMDIPKLIHNCKTH